MKLPLRELTLRGDIMYKFYISGILLPIPPSSLEISINDKDEEISLADGGTMSVLNEPGLTTYSFEFRVPNIKYPFAMYEDGFIEANIFLSLLEMLKMNQKPFEFKVLRGPTYVEYRDISTKVSLVEYQIKEDAENGGDYVVDIELKEYVKFETRKDIVLDEDGNELTITETTERDEPIYEEKIYQMVGTGYYVIQKGDTFHSISEKIDGHMNYAEAIAELNDMEFTTEELPYEGVIINVNKESLKKIAEKHDAEELKKQQEEFLNEHGTEVPGLGYAMEIGSSDGKGFWETNFPGLVNLLR